MYLSISWFFRYLTIIISRFLFCFVMSWILLPLIFYLPFGITTPINQFLQIESPPSLDGTAQEGANGGLTFQPAWTYPSPVASHIDLDPSAYSYPCLQVKIGLPRELTQAVVPLIPPDSPIQNFPRSCHISWPTKAHHPPTLPLLQKPT